MIYGIKNSMKNRIGSPIQVIAQTGRKRQVERKGVLSEVYPSLFVVNLDQEENQFERVSFSYSDVLTSTVEVKFLDEAEILNS
ncbi:MAG: Veg family protein [Lactobacillales bacterium]|jgi:uncharacterized protein Veg|nr:Veg family protein [Lactobacillales bacterium]